MVWQCKRGPQVSFLIFLCMVLGFAGTAGARQKPQKPVRTVKQSRASHATDAVLEQKNSALDSIKDELDRGRQRLAQLSNQEGTETVRLTLLDTSIRTTERYLFALGENIEGVGAELAGLDSSLVGLGKQLNVRQRAMAVRLRSMYKSGSETLLQTAMTSGSLSQILDRTRYFQALHRYDTLLMHAIDSTRSQVQIQKTKREARLETLYRLQQAKLDQQRMLETERSTRQQMIRDIQRQKTQYLARIKELEAAQRELNALIKKLAVKKKPPAKPEREAALGRQMEKGRGSYPWPLSGTIIRGFGKVVHPVYQTITMSNGIDIKSNKGTVISCIAPGKAVYVGRMRGMGTFVVIDHSGGLLSIYAHLENVHVQINQTVQQGTSLGTVGEGSAGAEPALHFEIRKNGDAVDPLDWLVEK